MNGSVVPTALSLRLARQLHRLLLLIGVMLAGHAHAQDASSQELATLIRETIAQSSPRQHCPQLAPEQAISLSPEKRVLSAEIINDMPGFAKVAGTVGGLGHRLFVVSNTDDYDPKGKPIAGSLRAAVNAAQRAGGGWIVFDATLGRGARIDLLSGLRIPANVTIDGGCSEITITGRVNEVIFGIPERNVIVTRLSFEKRGPLAINDDGDCISVLLDFDAIYIAHNNFGQCGDGQIDVTAPRPRGVVRRVTIAFNRFLNHNESMLVDAVDCEPSEKPCADPLASQPPKLELFVTLYGNLFFGTGQRHPRIAGHAFVHAINNVIAFENFRNADGNLGSAYGIFVGIGGRLLAEDNLIFLIRNQTNNRPLAIWTSESPGALRMPDPPGAVMARHILTTRLLREETVVGTGRAEYVPALPYVIDRSIDFAELGAQSAARCVARRAGMNGSEAWDPACNPRPSQKP